MSAREVMTSIVRAYGGAWLTDDEAADEVQALLTAAGYAIVPKEPTAAMLVAALPSTKPAVLDWCAPVARTDYRAMLAAAEGS